MYFEQLGSVLLAGDWNARVGKKIDYIDYDANVSDIDDYAHVSLFSRTQKVNDPCGQHIYIQEQCSTFDIDKDK